MVNCWAMSSNPDDLQSLRERLEHLERENQRLREKMEPILGPDNPCFDVKRFQKTMGRNMVLFMTPMYLMAALTVASIFATPSMGRMHLFSVRVIDFSGMNTRHPGLGLGWLAIGGASLGAVSCGGLGVGLISFGGASVGVIAIGGGSVGIIAIGGGALGVIAIGGGACGYYALGVQKGAGKYVVTLNRQDPEAVEFFTRWIPGLRNVFTTAMPVIPIEKPGMTR